MSGARTVAVVGANSLVGRLLLERLTGSGWRTVALVRKADSAPTAMETVPDWPHNPRAAAVLRDADAVVHLVGELFATRESEYGRHNVEPARQVAGWLKDSNAQRVVFLSYLGASKDSPNAYLRAKAEAEEALIGSGRPTVVFRCPALIHTPADPGPYEQRMIANGTAAVRVIGSGRQRVQPLFRGDAVSAIEAALTRGAPSTYDLVGPRAMTADDLARLVNGERPIRIAHTADWVLRAFSFAIPVPRAALELALRDAVGDPSRAVSTFGLALTDLAPIWRSAAASPAR